MTNLEIIKYLANNNPDRLAELLKDIYFSGFTSGIWERLEDAPDFKDWIIYADPTKCTLYDDKELEEWSKAINSTPTITTFYDGLSVTFPAKDPDHMWNNNNEYDYKENNK